MSSLWVTNDAIAQERMNRMALPLRLLEPVYDVDDANAVTVTAKPIDGAAMVATTETTHYTVAGSGVAVAVVHRITLCNVDTVANHAGVYLVASGGSGVGANVIFWGNLEAGETVQLEGPWFLDPSDSVRSYSNSAGAANVGLRCEVTEYAATVAGITLKVVDGSQLTTSQTAYYTCPGSGVRHANVVALTVCNFDSVARGVLVEVRPSGGTLQTKQYVLNAPAAIAGETVIIGGFVLEPGDAIYARASANSAVSLRVSAVEYAST